MGYLTDCMVYIDDNDNVALENDERAVLSPIGLYSIPYIERGAVRVLSAIDSGTNCRDVVLGSPLKVALETTTNATMASALTSVASQLVRRGGRDEDAAGELVCLNLIPCVPCSHPSSTGKCNTTTNCLTNCRLWQAPLSVFHFDSFREIIENPLNAIWMSWLVAQVNTEYSVGCAKDALSCASPQLCGSGCALSCGDDIGNYSTQEVVNTIWATLADMVSEKAVKLEDPERDDLLELMIRTNDKLGTRMSDNYIDLASGCTTLNYNTYRKLVFDEDSSSRKLESLRPAHFPDVNSSIQKWPRDNLADMFYHACILRSGIDNCIRPIFGCMAPKDAHFNPSATVHRVADCAA